jgi:hypothetical protein
MQGVEVHCGHREPEHQPAGPPVGKVQVHVEVAGEQLGRIGLEVAPVVLVPEPRRCDLGPHRDAAKLRHLLGGQPAVERQELIALVLTHNPRPPSKDAGGRVFLEPPVGEAVDLPRHPGRGILPLGAVTLAQPPSRPPTGASMPAKTSCRWRACKQANSRRKRSAALLGHVAEAAAQPLQLDHLVSLPSGTSPLAGTLPAVPRSALTRP